ncbi:helix-turn-helix transcriptional regulator [Bacillus sp. Gen3]|nr:helix-turn-helix transcriptional regulator [Bacillus sp. Gen3]
MHIGTRIRFYRLLRGLSPEELSDGITALSYLASIENNGHTPPIEMLSQLCDRLEIPFMTYPNEELTQLLDKWKPSLLQNDQEESSAIFEEISSKLSDSVDFQLILTYHVYLIRYYLIQKQLEKAKELIEMVKPFHFEMADDLKFSFQKFHGNYLYYTNQFAEAASLFNNAKNYLFAIDANLLDEKADLYYMYGLTLGRINKNTLSVFYIEEALSLFQQTYQMKRCTDCHMLLGVVYSKMQEYSDSEHHYTIAKQLAKSISYTDLIDKIEHNLGLLKSRQGKSKEAITHYLNSYEELDKKKTNDQLQIIINIINEYYKIGFIHEVNIWLEHGFSLIESIDQQKEHYIELTFFQYIVRGYPEGFEDFILNIAIPYFEERKQNQSIILYSKKLGEYYQKKKRFKEAALSFAKANSVYEKILEL